MDIKEALEWANKNSSQESVDRLRSRKVVKVLSDAVKNYRQWIAKEGERTAICTFNIIGEVCSYCECHRKTNGKE